jgi:hypothetical protein
MSNNFKKALLEMSNAWDQIHPPQWLVNMANGMASGASMGSAAGPVGMAVGGIVGGAAGVVRDQFPESASFNDRFGSFPNAGKPNTQNLAAAMGGKDPNATVTVDPNAAKNALALAQPRLGLLGQLPSTKKQEASKPDSDSKQKETPHDVADLRRAA